ncbi:hypothetical protein ACUL41_14880 [Virgibacillus natechei]
MENKNRELVQEMDTILGGILINVEQIKTLKEELGRMREGMGNTDFADKTAVVIQFMESFHTIKLVDDLLGYAAKELDSN